MKNEIRLLRKAQKVLWENQYPGYPFQMSVIVDLEEQCAWVDYVSHKTNLNEAIAKIYGTLMYVSFGARNTDKRTFIIDQHLEDYKKYLDYDEEDFYIDNVNAVRFYFALSSAIYNRKKNDKRVVFAVIDDESDFVDVQVFDNIHDIEEYVKDFYEDED